jgi:hypothetical protein
VSIKLNYRNENEFDVLNNRIKSWSKGSVIMMKSLVRGQVKEKSSQLANKLRFTTFKEDALIAKVSFKLERQGIWIEKGVSKHYEVNPKGSGNVVKKSAGPFNRFAKPWIAPTMEARMPELTEMVSVGMAEICGKVARLIQNYGTKVR